MKPLPPAAEVNFKQSPTPSKININLHNRGLSLSQFLLLVQLSTKKLQGTPKGRKKKSEETKQASDSNMTELLELLGNLTYYN